jgi:aspartate kinase
MSEPSTPTSSAASTPSLSSIDSPPPPSTPPSLHQNTIVPEAKWLVQKYGGTSVGKFASQIAENIVPYAQFCTLRLPIQSHLKFLVNPCSDYLDRYKLAIVCSARSGSTKALGTTNLLLRAASEALRRPAPILSPVQSGAATPLTDSLISRSSRTGSPPFAEPCTVSFSKTVDLIQSEHIMAARDCVKGTALLAELEAEIVRDCESLRSFLSATQVRRP